MAKKTKTEAQAPAKSEGVVARARRFLTTADDDIRKRSQIEAPGPGKARRGPRIGTLSPADELIITASEDELREFVEIVRERREQARRTIWLRCDKCHFAGAFDAARVECGSSCPRCNLAHFATGGHLVEMTEAEVREWQSKKAAQDARELEQMRAAAFIRRNQGRAKDGLPPLTRDEFDAEERVEWQRVLRQQAQLTRVAEAIRKPFAHLTGGGGR